jgi:hypothetical protein
MAVAIRGTTPGTSSGVGDPTSLTLTGARQPQAGDVLVIIHCNDFYALSNIPTPTVGGSSTGVVAVTNGAADGGTDLAHIKSFTYVAASTGDLTVAVDETGSADEEKALIVYVLSGVDTTTPIDIAGNSSGTASTSHICPDISPTSSDAFLICHVNTGGPSGNITYTAPGGMTDQYDINIGAVMALGGATQQLSASGATGTRTFTGSGSAPYGSLSIAVKTGGAAAATDPNPQWTERLLPGRIGPDGNVYLPDGRGDSDTVSAAGTNAPAGSADAAGTAPQPAIAIAPTAGAASTTGVAPQAVAAVKPNAGAASAAGAALQPATAIAPSAGAASAAGSAPQPAAAVRANAGVAEASGVANQATVSTVPSTSAPAGLAAATGAANVAGIAVGAAAGLAAVSGAALGPFSALRVNAGAASATGTAPAATSSLRVNAGVATAAGAAPQPTVSTSSAANAPAGLAAATGSAFAPAIRLTVPAGVTTATGLAPQPTVSTIAAANAPAGLAAASGTAFAPAVRVGVLAGVAAGTAAANQVSVTVPPPLVTPPERTTTVGRQSRTTTVSSVSRIVEPTGGRETSIDDDRTTRFPDDGRTA